jgi:hypothetical protein
VSPAKYELGFYIPEVDILHSHRRESLKSYIALKGLGFVAETECVSCEVRAGALYPKVDILHSQLRDNIKSYTINICNCPATKFMTRHQTHAESPRTCATVILLVPFVVVSSNCGTHV